MWLTKLSEAILAGVLGSRQAGFVSNAYCAVRSHQRDASVRLATPSTRYML